MHSRAAAQVCAWQLQRILQATEQPSAPPCNSQLTPLQAKRDRKRQRRHHHGTCTASRAALAEGLARRAVQAKGAGCRTHGVAARVAARGPACATADVLYAHHHAVHPSFNPPMMMAEMGASTSPGLAAAAASASCQSC